MNVENARALPPGWESIRVRELADSIQYGHTASAVHSADGPRFLRITDIQDGGVDWNSVPSCEISKEELDKYRLSPGDLVFARTGATTGKSYLIRDCPEAVFASYLIRVRVSNAVEPRYLAAFFQSPEYWAQIEEGKRGIGQPNVNGKVLGEVLVPIAPRHEQLPIVSEIDKHLTRLDVGVAALRRVQANLKRYRAAVLQAACEGRLVPTESELARREMRSYESGSALLKRILAAKSQRVITRSPSSTPAKTLPPGVAVAPVGWIWATASQLGQVQLGRQRSPKNVSRNYPTKYLRAANITEQGLDLSDVLEMEFSPEERKRYALRSGDIVLSEASGSATRVGKPAIWREELPLCCFQNTVIRFRALLLESSYPLLVFRHFYFNGIFARAAGGVGINHLGAQKFSGMVLPLPPLAEQSRIVAEVERRLSVIEQIEASVIRDLQRAVGLREVILERAFRGTLTAQDRSANEPIEVAPEHALLARRVPDGEEEVTTPLKYTGAPGTGNKRKVREVVRAAQGPMTPEELFVRCGRDGHDIEDIELFFRELRELIDEGFAEDARSDGTVTVRRRR